jgi:hypothetical protein
VCEVSDLLVRKEEGYRPSTAIVMVERGFYNVETEGCDFSLFFVCFEPPLKKSRYPNESHTGND